ncbi:hypothetical protein HMPREF0433_01035 [Gemella sanguinis M325]|jgi:hypothetical protein|uniref:Uncharacterized protein n=1 Tax=Gemella sanguinis TaxID=84135 RepID=A0ABX6FHM8_9BACL|nr:hypothetical protein [Gemella sanguinis]EGF87550.1 hypothetical protein HMPREF0433_01035 [Gemella sanguinis M325]QGS07011.1 hypothetical protein FOC50_01270 [Gemella sanguinis]
MLNKKIKITLFIVSVLTIIVAYGILMPPKVLTRENNKGNEYKQLDRLMNTTRYAEQVRKAGYQVDDYDLQMMDRIPRLELTGEKDIVIQSPVEEGEIYVYMDKYTKLIIFDKNMNIVGSNVKQDKDTPSRDLTEEEKTKYEKEVKEEINKLLDDVYNAGKE